MIETMPVTIKTAAKAKGPTWAKRYPDKADELYVVASAGKKKTIQRIGPPTPQNQARAERVRDDLAKILGQSGLVSAGMLAPVFEDAASEYRRAGMKDHAWKTCDARKHQHKRAAQSFGSTPLDQIDADQIVSHYEALRSDGLADRTAQRHLDAISTVYQWHETTNPVPDARTRIAKKAPKTAITRALDESNCKPVSAEAMAKVLSRAKGDLLTTILLCYDGGFRLGEATGLKWADISFGTDANDTSRSMLIRQTRVGNRVGPTKSGLPRRVGMTRRLREHLIKKFMSRGRPARGWVVEQSWHKNIHERLGRAAKAAKLDKPNFKDFRDTYASTLITHGIVLKWISLQLGHRSVAVTERHYARYMAVDGYQNPYIVPEGCLPPDLIRLVEQGKLAGVTTESHSVTTVHN